MFQSIAQGNQSSYSWLPNFQLINWFFFIWRPCRDRQPVRAILIALRRFYSMFLKAYLSKEGLEVPPQIAWFFPTHQDFSPHLRATVVSQTHGITRLAKAPTKKWLAESVGTGFEPREFGCYPLHHSPSYISYSNISYSIQPFKEYYVYVYRFPWTV